MSLLSPAKWGQALLVLKQQSDKVWFYPAILLLLGLVTYGYSLGSLGYYWDDWEVVFLVNARNPALFSDYFAFDRPFAWPYQVMYALVGLNPVAWHLSTLLLRWGGIVLLYLSLKWVWPRYEPYLRWLGALLFVYPGYLQQSTSAAYNRHFTAFFVFALSIYLMVLAIRRPARAWLLLPLSWLTAFVQVFTIEYFVGLELVRPVLLWLILVRDRRLGRVQVAGRVTALALPYLSLLAFYFWWRLLVFPSTIPVSNYSGDFKLLADFDVSLFSGVFAILTCAVLDLVYSTLRVWLVVLSDADGFTFQSKIAWFAFGMGGALSAFFAFFNPVGIRLGSKQGGSSRSLMAFGLWAFLVSALPIWLTSRQLSGGGRWDDRFSLAAMLGAGILAVTLVDLLVHPRWHKWLLGVLLALSVTTQILTVNRFRLEWVVQNSYYWQLAWRVPALKPQTAIVSLEQPSASIPGYDASFAMNILFNGQTRDGAVPYWFFTNDRFLNFDFVPGKAIAYKDRNLKFTGNTSEAISIVHQGEDRCLQVLDSVYAKQPFYASGQEQLVAVSNVSRIRRESKAPPPPQDIFGPEPPHTWCYYFEKADLARQFADWETVLKLEQQAAAAGRASKFGPEYVPFIEAHAQLGDWSKALALSQAARESISEMEPLLCSTWNRLSVLPLAEQATVRDARQAFDCLTP